MSPPLSRGQSHLQYHQVRYLNLGYPSPSLTTLRNPTEPWEPWGSKPAKPAQQRKGKAVRQREERQVFLDWCSSLGRFWKFFPSSFGLFDSSNLQTSDLHPPDLHPPDLHPPILRTPPPQILLLRILISAPQPLPAIQPRAPLLPHPMPIP